MSGKKSPPSPDDVCAVGVIDLKRISQAQGEALPTGGLQRLADSFKIEGDPDRLKHLNALKSGDMCGCDPAAFLGISESAVSNQLLRLKDARLVYPRRQGQIRFYHMDDECVVAPMASAIDLHRRRPDPHRCQSRCRRFSPSLS